MPRQALTRRRSAVQFRPGPPSSTLNTRRPSLVGRPLNKNLLVFSILLITLGIGFDLYPISFLGLILLIPSLLTPSKVPTGTVPQPSQRTKPYQSQQPRRVAPPPTPQPAAAAQAQPQPQAPMAAPTGTPIYSSALFPTPMFPTLSLPSPMAQPVKETQAVKAQEKDELVEVGAILALLKVAFG